MYRQKHVIFPVNMYVHLQMHVRSLAIRTSIRHHHHHLLNGQGVCKQTLLHGNLIRQPLPPCFICVSTSKAVATDGTDKRGRCPLARTHQPQCNECINMHTVARIWSGRFRPVECINHNFPAPALRFVYYVEIRSNTRRTRTRTRFASQIVVVVILLVQYLT